MNAQANQIAQQAGFSRTSSTASQFILFDDDTDGRCGRAVYIDSALLNQFSGGSEKGKAELRYVFHRIKQLKAKAGGLSSHFDPANPKQRVSMIGKVKVSYTILQDGHNHGKPSGVYITGLDLARFNDLDPGLYHVEQDRRDFVLNKKPQTEIKTTRAAVNGLCEDAEQAASTILPPMIDTAYGDQKWAREAGGLAADDSYTLFFNPPQMYNSGKPLKSQAEGLNQRYAAQSLAKALLRAQAKGKKVQWTVHGDGIHTFHNALKLAGNKDLSCHTAVFLSPNKDVSQILPLMKNTQMAIHDKVFVSHKHDVNSQAAQSGNGERLRKGLVNMGYDAGKAQDFKTKANERVLGTGQAILGTLGVGGAIGAAILAPATAIPTLSVAGAVGSGFALKGMYNKTTAAKDMVAARMNSTEREANPHLNPFADEVEMRRRSNAHYKAQGMSFVRRVLMLG
ncbi:hypothetical protein [Agaribacterium sp. ZY112]|uniref:hypothetical protein n=1 Tax=Agaribacterium sp. ZY112 TaxID=3233574 RepID=UPI0035263886